MVPRSDNLPKILLFRHKIHHRSQTINPKEAAMQKDVHSLLESSEFKSLVAKRAKISILLTILLFLSYYGFVLLIGYNKPFLAQKLDEATATTLGIPLAVSVILASWLLTVIYVVWANAIYDPEVKRLRAKLFGK